MSDLTARFNSRIAEGLGESNNLSNKFDSLVRAKENKILQLEQSIARRRMQEQQQQEAFDKSNVGILAEEFGLNLDGLPADLVNKATIIGNSFSRAAGYVGSGVWDALGTAANQHLPDEVKAARGRQLRGEATPADIELLNLPAGDLVKKNYPKGTDYETNAERIGRMEKYFQNAQDVRGFFDLSSSIDQRAANALQGDIVTNAPEGVEQIKKTADALKAGNYREGFKAALGIIPELAPGVLKAGADNPNAVLNQVLDQASNLASGGAGKGVATAMNALYGVDAYGQGIQEKIAAGKGEMPTDSSIADSAKFAALAAGAEVIGDKVTGVYDLAKTLGKGATEAATEAAKKSFKEALLGSAPVQVSKAAAGGFLGEGITEGTQTYLEEAAKGKEATAEEIAIGAGIGGLSGGAMSGSIKALGSVSAPDMSAYKPDLTESKPDDLFDKAVASNDPSVYLKEDKQDFVKAAQVLHAAATQDNVDTARQEENLTKLSELVGTLTNKRGTAAEATPEGRANTEKILEEQKQKLAAATTEEERASIQENIDFLVEDLNYSSQIPADQVKAAQEQVAKFDQQIAQVQKLQQDLASRISTTDTNTTGVASDEDNDPQRVITLSMASPNKVSSEVALRHADDLTNGLSDQQRTYLRQFAQSRVLENSMMDMGKVHNEVLFGNPARNQLGITNYRQRMADAIAAKDQKQANRVLIMQSKFLASHKAKQEIATRLLASVKKGQTIQVVRTADGRWEVSPSLLSSEEQVKNGGFKIHPNSKGLVQNIAREAEALKQAQAEFKSAYAMAFTQSTSTEISKPSTAQVTAPAVDQTTTASNQSTVDSTVDQQQEASTETKGEAQEVSQSPKKKPRKRTEPKDWQNIVGAILRATGGEGINLKHTLDLLGEDAKNLTRTRKAFHGSSLYDPTEVIEGLNEEGYSVRDATHLAELLQEHEKGNTVYSDEKQQEMAERDRIRSENERYKAWRREINAKAKAAGIKQARGTRTIEQVEEELNQLENELSLLEAEEERAAILAAEVFSEDLVNQDATAEQILNEMEEEDVQNPVTEESVAEVSQVQATEAIESGETTSESTSGEGIVDEESASDGNSETNSKQRPKPAGRLIALEADQSVELTEETKLGKDMVPAPIKDGVAPVYRMMNKAVAWLKQKAVEILRDEDIEADRPLVSIKDFVQAWKNGEVGVDTFFPEGVTDEQKINLENFIAFAEKFNTQIAGDFVKGSAQGNKRIDFVNIMDPIQDFISENPETGELVYDENLVTAMSYAAYSWLANTASGPRFNRKKDILALFGLDEESKVSKEGQDILSEVAATDHSVANNLGRMVVDALGLKTTEDAPSDYLPKLTQAFGMHVLEAMKKDGLIEIGEISTLKLWKYIPDLAPKEMTPDVVEKAKLSYTTLVQLNRKLDQNNQRTDALVPTVAQIVESNRGSRGILDRLIDSTKPAVLATWKPQKFTQAKAKRSGQDVPKKLASILNNAQQVPNRIIPEMWKALEVLGDDVILTAAGFDARDESTIQQANRDGVKAQNDNLRNQLERMKDLVQDAIKNSPEGISQPFYAAFNVWKNYRVGVTTADMNLQSSKIHRFMFFRPNWESTVNLANQKEHQQFLVSVAQAFGLKTDQKSAEKIVAEWKSTAAADNNQINNLSLKLYQATLEDGAVTLSDAEKKAIGKVSADNEGMQTLQAMMAYGNYLANKKAESIKVRMLVGVDGKTNGPILSMLALGAADTVGGLFDRINRGGMFRSADKHQNFNLWYEEDGSMDLYQDFAKVMLQALTGDPLTMRAIQYFTGRLDTPEGKVSKHGRNLVKTPLTAFSFGSSIDGSVNSMFDAFIESIYNKIEEANQDRTEESRKAIIAAINVLIADRSNFLPANTSFDELMNLNLDSKSSMIFGAFNETIGKAVTATLKSHYASYSANRFMVNKIIGGGFGIYNHVRGILYQQELNKMIEEGKIDASFSKDGKASPYFTLNRKQTKELEDRIRRLMPTVHTAYSSKGDSLNAGLFMAKTSMAQNENLSHRIETQFRTPVQKKKDKVSYQRNGYAMERVEVAPGVAGLPYLMHSFDSAVMHLSFATPELRESTQAVGDIQTLNVHDEAANGVGNVHLTAQAINHSLFEQMLNFSPMKQSFDMFNRVVIQSAEMIKQGQLTPEDARGIVAYFPQFLSKSDQKKSLADRLTISANAMKYAQYEADSIRLGALAEMTSLDQYTWEGGEYRTTEQDRARAAKALSDLQKEGPIISKEMQAAIQTIADFMSGLPVETTETKEETIEEVVRFQDVYPVTAEYVALQLVGEMPDVKEAKDFLAGIRQNKTAKQLIEGIENLSIRNRIIEAIARIQGRMPSNIVTSWGLLGQPKNVPNQNLYNALLKKPSMTGMEAINLVSKLMDHEGSSNTKLFQLRLLNALKSVISKADLTVQLIQANSPESDALSKPNHNDSYGWFSQTKEGKQRIHLLSPDFQTSNLTPELLVHELLHAALANVIADGREQLNSDAAKLYKDLELILSAARSYVAGKKEIESKIGNALESVDELVSWGLTNEYFQTEVLEKIAVDVPANANDVLKQETNLFKRFLNKIVDYFFKGRKDKSLNSGLYAVVKNAAALASVARDNLPKHSREFMQSMATVAAVNNYTSLDIYRSLGTGQISGAFDQKLKGLLVGIVNSLYGLNGTLSTTRTQNQSGTAASVWDDAKNAREVDFATEALAAGVGITDQEAFVLEQVEVTARTALDSTGASTTTAYKELYKLYREVANKIQPSDLDPDPVRAQALWNFIFRQDNKHGDVSDYLSRFAAMGLAHEGFNKALKVATSRTVSLTQGRFVERLENWFNRVLEWAAGKLTHTYAGQNADEKLETLITKLVSIEQKHRDDKLAKSLLDLKPVEDVLKSLSEGLRTKIGQFGNSNFIQQNRIRMVAATGKVVSMAAQDQLDQLRATLQDFRDRTYDSRQGILAGLLNEAAGATSDKVKHFVLNRMAKNMERIRQEQIAHVGKLVMSAFNNNGQDLTDQQKNDITHVLLRSDAASLLDTYGLNGIQNFLNDANARKQEIAALETALGSVGLSRYTKYYINQAKTLAYYKATGKVGSLFMLMNANNIVTLKGTNKQFTGNTQQATNAESIVDRLITLYAMDYTNAGTLASVAAVMNTEMSRQEGNGVELLLKIHKDMQQESKDKLFRGDEALFFKGYTPEIFNPHNEVKVANDAEGQNLLAKGYKKVGRVSLDPHDPDKTPRSLYVLKFAGQRQYVSGNLSLTGTNAKGSRSASDDVQDLQDWIDNQQNLDAMNARKLRDINQLFSSDIDPKKSTHTYAVPVLDSHGNVADYRYLMNDETKDTLLERNNSFEQVMGMMAGSIYDKTSASDHNRKVVEALHQQYTQEFSTKSHSYRWIAADGKTEEDRQNWIMLPDKTKQMVKDIWGTEGMWVRNDLLDLTFGYRMPSMAEVFNKDPVERKIQEKIFVSLLEHFFDKKAALRVRQFEDVWQEVVHEIKDIWVIKSFTALWNNTKSNISMMLWHGISPKDIVRYHRIALRGATDYRRDTEELEELRRQVQAGYSGVNPAVAQRRINELESSLARNPVRKLIDAGLMPSIVEDVDADKEMYSYKSLLQNKTSKYTSKVPKALRKSASYVYMTKDTKMYQLLHYGTQVSDFMARYTLYMHLTQRSENPMSHEDAIQRASDTFVNYDIPAHRLLTYLNSMGLVLFTKYYIRIQKVLMSLFREEPGKALALLAMDGYFANIGAVTESSMLNHLNNPFSLGALKYPESLDDLATVKTGMALFK